MENTNNNRKALKTAKKLREELAGLMMEKELDKITVNELTQRADIHRTTFYCHFQDIYDLYDTTEKDIIHELDELLIKNFQSGDKDFFRKALDYIRNNPKICRMIFCGNPSGTLRKKFDEFIEDLCKKDWADVTEADPESVKFEYLFRYHIRGCMAVIEKWVENDFEESEKFIIKIISRIETNARNFIISEVSGKK